MTRREVLAWLAARRPIPPDALRAGIEAVVSDAELTTGSIPARREREGTRPNTSHVAQSCAGAHRVLHSFPTRRSSDLDPAKLGLARAQARAIVEGLLRR